jgi:hypothetical protein
VRTAYSLKDPYQKYSLAGLCNYANPVYTNKDLYEFFKKAEDDFNIDPKNTSFFVIVPLHWPNSDWWDFTRHYRVIKVYPKGSLIFTCPAAGVYDINQLKPAGDEGGPDRYFISGTPWPVYAIHRDFNTPVTIDDPVKLHLRLGHLSTRYLIKLIKLRRGNRPGHQPEALARL